MEFEWDETKNQQNLAKHGFDFTFAVRISTGRCAATSIFGRAMSRVSSRPDESKAGSSQSFIPGAMDVSHHFRPTCPVKCEVLMPSRVYDLFHQAMAGRKQIVCTYGGYGRELCPIILGHSGGEEKALTYQFGGQSKSGLPPGGEWRCLWLSKVSHVELRDGPWHSGSSHTQPQGCVDIVDFDVNRSSPYSPKRRL